MKDKTFTVSYARKGGQVAIGFDKVQAKNPKEALKAAEANFAATWYEGKEKGAEVVKGYLFFYGSLT